MIELSDEDIAKVMCAVAADNTWKQGKRGYVITSRDLFGIKLSVRQKDFTMTLSSDGGEWRVAVQIDELGFLWDNSADEYRRIAVKTVKVPRFMENRMTYDNKKLPRELWNNHTTFAMHSIKNPVIDVLVVEKFERDWTLLRMFCSE